MGEDVRKLLALSARMDARGRITNDEYARRLDEVRGRCIFRAVDVEDFQIVGEQYGAY